MPSPRSCWRRPCPLKKALCSEVWTPGAWLRSEPTLLETRWIVDGGRVGTLLFKSQTADETQISFHEHCDDKGPTVVVVRGTDNDSGAVCVWGGFSSISWRRTDGGPKFRDPKLGSFAVPCDAFTFVVDGWGMAPARSAPGSHPRGVSLSPTTGAAIIDGMLVYPGRAHLLSTGLLQCFPVPTPVFFSGVEFDVYAVVT